MTESIGHWDNSDIRAIVQDAVHRALHPEPLTSKPLHPIITRSAIGVEVQFTDFDGQSYRGVLYPTQTEDKL